MSKNAMKDRDAVHPAVRQGRVSFVAERLAVAASMSFCSFFVAICCLFCDRIMFSGANVGSFLGLDKEKGENFAFQGKK